MIRLGQDDSLGSVLGAMGNTPFMELSRIARGLNGRILARLGYLSMDLWL